MRYMISTGLILFAGLAAAQNSPGVWDIFDIAFGILLAGAALALVMDDV